MNYSFWSLFTPPTAEEKKFVRDIKGMKELYPSLKVVGRGTVTIQPIEILQSPAFKIQFEKADDLIKQ